MAQYRTLAAKGWGPFCARGLDFECAGVRIEGMAVSWLYHLTHPDWADPSEVLYVGRIKVGLEGKRLEQHRAGGTQAGKNCVRAGMDAARLEMRLVRTFDDLQEAHAERDEVGILQGAGQAQWNWGPASALYRVETHRRKRTAVEVEILGHRMRAQWARLTPDERRDAIERRFGTSEERSMRTKRWLASLTPEERHQRAAAARAGINPENLRESGRNFPADIRRENGRKVMARMSADERSDFARRGVMSQTPEQRRRNSSHAGKKSAGKGVKAWWASLTAEERSERARQRALSKPPEERREIARWAALSGTPEERSERGRRAALSGTAEERSQRAREARLRMSPERRRELARAAKASQTPQQRSDNSRRAAHKFWDSLTSEERRRVYEQRWGTIKKLSHVRWHIKRGIRKPGCPHCETARPADQS